jgi:hypothetical protein
MLRVKPYRKYCRKQAVNGARAELPVMAATSEEDRQARYDPAIKLLIEFQAKHGLEECFRRLRAFMVSYANLLSGVLPDVAKRGLEVAKNFSAGEATDEDLDSAAADCWKHLESIGDMYDFSRPENLAVRAVLCTLTRTSSGHDLEQTIHYFLIFADGVEDHSSEVDRLLRRHFL